VRKASKQHHMASVSSCFLMETEREGSLMTFAIG
ncbi:hypothetical protein Tco_0889148, partial [Tanacetum coccineum]